MDPQTQSLVERLFPQLPPIQADFYRLQYQLFVPSGANSMDLEQLRRFFARIKQPESLVEGYFRAIRLLKKPFITCDEFVLACTCMDHETPHKADFLELRLRYSFLLFDQDLDEHLTELEFANLIKEIRRMKRLPIDDQAVLDAFKEEAAKFPPKARISFTDFVDHVKKGIFRNTSVLFRFEADVRKLISSSHLGASPSHNGVHSIPPSPHTPEFPSQPTWGLNPPQREGLAASPVQTHVAGGGAMRGNLVDSPQQNPHQNRSPGAGKVRFHQKRVIVENSPGSPGASLKKSIQPLNPANCTHALKKVDNIRQPFLPSADFSNEGRIVAQTAMEHLLLLRTDQKILPEHPFSLCTPVEIGKLCSEAISQCMLDSMMVEVNGPVKIFGDIHGQLYDLLTLFDAYGSPNDVTGDIDDVSYVFLGDFVDRGPYSLEVVTLLCALKVLYPARVFLIRGNHEDRTMNSQYGFKQECQRRAAHLGPDAPEHLWESFNLVFDSLPIAARLHSSILCVHGGIGNISTLAEIQALQRPMKMVRDNSVAVDVLWSDPTDSDGVTGIHPNTTRGISVKFGPDTVETFCQKNNLDMIIRAHEVVTEGFELFAGGKLVTIFSATNYGRCNNAGALVHVSSNSHVRFKSINPADNNWIDALDPPTPPRANSPSPLE